MLADSVIGYICCFEPYYGKCTTDRLARPDMSFTSQIVLHLCDELLHIAQGSGYHVFTDRFYTGFPLALGFVSLGPFHCARFIFVLCITVCCNHDCLGL